MIARMSFSFLFSQSVRFRALAILIIGCTTLPSLIPSTSITEDGSRPQYSHLLQDVLEVISVRQRWDSGQLKVSKLDVAEVRFGSTKSYEFRIRLGKDNFFFRFSDEVASWKKFGPGESDFQTLVDKVNSTAVLYYFKLEGPFELSYRNGYELSLSLPRNTSLNGVKRVLVGQGITLEVRSAREVSLFCASDVGPSASEFWPFRHASCFPLPSIHILGSASFTAYKIRNPDAYIKFNFKSKDTVELLPEKCYDRQHLSKMGSLLINSLSSRYYLLAKILRSLLGDKIKHNGLLDPVNAKVKASTIMHFQLELERTIGINDTLEMSLPKWRTKPTVERVMFDVMARVEAGLKPVMVKKVKPFMAANSAAWSSITSNISFTQFPSALGPSEALTLDIKW